MNTITIRKTEILLIQSEQGDTIAAILNPTFEKVDLALKQHYDPKDLVLLDDEKDFNPESLDTHFRYFFTYEDGEEFYENIEFTAVAFYPDYKQSDEPTDPKPTRTLQPNKAHLCKCNACDAVMIDMNPYTGQPELSRTGVENNTIRATEAGKKAVSQLFKKLLDMAELPEVEAINNVADWINDDLDYINVKYFGNSPDGDTQKKYDTNGEPMMTDTEAINLLNVRYNNTLTAIGQ